jgi:hypothetical protein
MGCLPAEAEYLSQYGWKQIQDYQEGDKIAIPKDNGFVFEYPENYQSLPCATFYRLTSQCGLEFIMSVEHGFEYINEEGQSKTLPVWAIVETIARRVSWKGTIRTLDSAYNIKHKHITFDKRSVSVVDRPEHKKYCFKTSTGRFIVRFNDNIFITGNSGKSYMALLYPLKFTDDPWFRGIIFRRTIGELKAQGSLWENAQDIYISVFGKENLKIHQNDLKITFPSGASLKLSYCENDNDVRTHKGAQYSFVLLDEACDFNKYQVEYLLGRIRSAKAKHHKQFIMTCNPDPDWFGLEWIKPYLLEDGTPDTTKDGMVRWYVVDNNTYVWADTREELEERFDTTPKSFTFISANCHDNVPLLEADPDYPSRLQARDWVDVQRYYYG